MVRGWNVLVQDTLETERSFLAFGRRGNQPVVLKVLRQPGDEWRCGEVLEAFDGRGMVRVMASGDNQIPKNLVERGQHLYLELCASQKGARLLHGDLHHYNVLLDFNRGWTAIDPKGVVGEIEYEIGASLRNPCENPELFASPGTVERRLMFFAARLSLDPDRALKWGFAQAVLSAIWSVEDGGAVDARNPSIMLAHAIQPLLG